MTRQVSATVIGLVLSAGIAHGQMADDDRQWIQDVLSLWSRVSAEDLGLGDRPLPWVVFFDPEWVWHVNAAAPPPAPEGENARSVRILVGEQELVAIGFPHQGHIELPDGGQIPPQLILFASTHGDPASPYFVMAMPRVWRGTPRHANDEHLDELIAAVFVHEITHTQQADALGARIDELVAENGLDDAQMDDDIIQHRFGERPGYHEAYERERDLLFAAAATETDSTCLAFAREAWAAMQKRRTRWFVGEETFYEEIEDIFLNFEGVANWAAYRALIASGIPEGQALPQLRRG